VYVESTNALNLLREGGSGVRDGSWPSQALPGQGISYGNNAIPLKKVRQGWMCISVYEDIKYQIYTRLLFFDVVIFIY
jgi:hypothetical protein